MNPTDARISTALPSHPKFKKLCRTLGNEGGLALFKLILWAAQNRSDGDFAGMTDDDIELSVDWSGEPGKLVAILVDVRFVDGGPGERRMHDWQDHNPWAAGADDRAAKGRWASLCKQYGREGAAQRADHATVDLQRSAQHRQPRSRRGAALAGGARAA